MSLFVTSRDGADALYIQRDQSRFVLREGKVWPSVLKPSHNHVAFVCTVCCFTGASRSKTKRSRNCALDTAGVGKLACEFEVL